MLSRPWHLLIFYRFYKATVLSTNHIKPERQLLVKDAVRNAFRLLLAGAFDYSDPMLSQQIERIRTACPALLAALVAQSNQDTLDSETMPDNEIMDDIVSTPQHLKPAVRGKLKKTAAERLGLPTRPVVGSSFYMGMKAAMVAYGLHGIDWGTRTLYWYEQFSFTDR